ncbi:MAG: S8 family peptidase [Candidatus Limnocylindrales bacterium]
MNRRVLALLGSGLLLTAMLPASVAAKAPQAGQFTEGGNYIVQMADQPVVTYTGGVKGLKATAPRAGQKIDPLSATVVAYTGYLNGRHTAALKAAGGKKLYDYVYSYNGFSAKLTAAQANKVAGLSGVLAVTPDEVRTADTSSTPAFLGLSDPGGLWEELGGVGSAGDGIIIGVIDTGIWPESLSFSDRTDKVTGAPSNAPGAKLAYQQIPGWHGKCTSGEAFVASMCNQKLIGAQWFNQGFGGDAGIDADFPWEFNSARDYGGHGTHTSSTAGGNANVPVTGAASVFGTISGIAPHARIAMYKALWEVAPGQGSGTSVDLVAAIDQAVADGVDVINYSISGTRTNFRDPVEISFLYAAAAGIFVAESAGNEGPATSTVAHPGPWTTTVAAGTHNRTATATVTMGDASTFTGASVAASAVSAPIINAADAAMPGATADAVQLCFSTGWNGGAPALDPAKVGGKIVVCDRGISDRVDKSLAVLEAGGVGMVLVNPSNNSINADFHSVPTVHLNNDVYAAVHAYAALAGATATISKSVIDTSAPAPYTASFSSRGPLLASPDLLKPDLMAPGQDILAAVAPPGNSGRDFDLYSGTSMSSPHVAGLAALLMDLHPDWTPMMVKSALMTSAYDVLDGPSTDPLVIFRQGAGHVKPNSAADPGLVFNSTMTDWLGFLCGTQLAASYCTSRGIPVISPSDFNGASIAIGGLPGSQTVTRTVTNVGATGTYSFSFSGDGIDATVSPATFTLNAGQSETLEITVSRTDGVLNAYAGGQLTWSDGTHSVRIPVVARPVALAAPTEVSGSYNVTFGYTGDFTALARGLVPATTFTDAINTGQQLTYDVVVPAGSTYARFSLFDANTTPDTDLDLVVYGPTDAVVGSSGGGTSAEEVNLRDPAVGTYKVLVDGYATANPSTFTLFTWVLGSTAAGNMVVTAPASATFGTTGAIDLSFNDLTAGTKYLGSVAYSGAAGMPNPTIVRIDVP